jgi:hypothetical protein
MLRRMAIGMMLLVSASAASADTWNGCYAHRYDATHLTKNPRQILESLAVELFRAPTIDDDVWTVSIDATLLRNTKRWGNGGTCSAEKDMLRCGLDGDSGQITFERTADGLQLAVESLNLDVLDSPLPHAGIALGRNDPREIALRPADLKSCARQAETPKPSAGPRPDRWPGCYLRRYDAAHLASNPGQRVSLMAVSLARETDAPAGTYQMYVYALRPTAKGQLKNFGTCTMREAKLHCRVDVGQGGFVLTRTAEGLQLDNPERFHMRYESAEGGLMIEGDRDHRAFRLAPANTRDCQ